MESISQTRKGNIDILTVKGNIQHTDTPFFEREIDGAIQQGATFIVLNLAEIQHICSSALGALIALKRRIRRMDGDIRLVSVPGDVLRVLQITLLDRVFLVYDDVNAAVHSFKVQGTGPEVHGP